MANDIMRCEVNHMDLGLIREQITAAFLEGNDYERAEHDGYTDFKYPKLIPFMKFHVERYRVPGYGHLMTMHTKTAFGMELLTSSFMPGEKSVPYCLIDLMTVGKKRTVFVEYYECGAKGMSMPHLDEVHGKYSHLTEYEEKPKWYVGERAPYSLIKCGGNYEERVLTDMVMSSVSAYRAQVQEAAGVTDTAGIREFRERMINEGNPSSSVLEKVFGKEGAKDFFLKCVMPLDEKA